MVANKPQPEIDSLRPFRLVKYFSFTGLGLVLITTIVLSWVISNHAKKVLLERSETYSLLLAEHVNRQVFLQFVLPTVLRYGEIALRNSTQFNRLDTVVRNTTEGLNVDSVTIYDSKENIISYSTISEEVGVRDTGGKEYERALNGISSSQLISKASLLNLLPGSDPISSKLLTYIPFRRENPLSEQTDDIMGVTKVVQDLSDDMEAVLKLQLTIIAVSILIMGTLFLILTQIVTKANQINEARAQERRRLENKLNQAERLASLGEMVASVSHEIKNPLGIVRSTAEILNKRLKDQAPSSNKHLTEIIITETSRLDDIVREFLDFARPQVPKFTAIPINDLIMKVEGFMQPEFSKNNISVENNLAADLKPIHVDQNLLYRAFLNLFINAVQAMPDGGIMSVSTFLSPDEKKKVVISIEDTGIGMSEEKLAMIFTPFYTDKNRGTGLGLAIAKNIIKQHEGTITVESQEGKGSTFFITLRHH